MPSPSKPDACPLCGKPADPAHKPFCSQGCKDRDLLNWLDEGYRVPGTPADPDLPGLEQDGLDSER
ncbi:MAG TPA: DNA gyrase inhibitor YacG [Allosphingosinicella sp.]|nr:DNA gyrase inhibitor YacG [Allosphingosinicella sp.]